MGRFNKYSVGVGAERRAEKKYLLGSRMAEGPRTGLRSWASRIDLRFLTPWCETHGGRATEPGH